MTPTSPTGADRVRRAGFTLVEVMVVTALIGLAAGAVVMTLPDPRPPVGQQAEVFAARLVRAREEAILTGRPVAVTADARGYAFEVFSGGEWGPLEDGLFRRADWGKDVRVALPRETARTAFDPTGMAEPLTVALSRGEGTVSVTVDGSGEVRVDD